MTGFRQCRRPSSSTTGFAPTTRRPSSSASLWPCLYASLPYCYTDLVLFILAQRENFPSARIASHQSISTIESKPDFATQHI
ncbi:hypothetical protein RHGRI_034710 [Rhododendron griersonianum]|uniref:Uncharacterized protein n=1 Tax=Rhododendron griersonianum TaxID=479676 RepID=A0AAV6I2K4_9ERIC|nr:hypothetical protein RHGRI_034710 [Rhododendron griersonianum]